MRVRHAQFGVGTVTAVEEHNDDVKITVKFVSVGVKKLLAKYAKLEPAWSAAALRARTRATRTTFSLYLVLSPASRLTRYSEAPAPFSP